MWYHISDVINLWPGKSYSPFSVKKSKKVMHSPSWHILRFLEGTFSGPFFFPNRPRSLGICVGMCQSFARGGNVTWSTRATRKKEGYKQTPALDWSTTPSYSQKSEKSEVPHLCTFCENRDFWKFWIIIQKAKTMQTLRVSCSAAFITIIWGGPPQIRCYQSLARK